MRQPKSRGHLNPSEHAPITRLPAPDTVADLVSWFWIPEWDLPPGTTHRAMMLTYAACNLVVMPDGVIVTGPSTRISERVLAGTGWAVGALLRPAATPIVLTGDVRGAFDTEIPVDNPLLAATVRDAMASGVAARHEVAVGAVVDWLTAHAPQSLSAEAHAANRLLDIVDGPEPPERLDSLADRLELSPRAVQRIARRYTGITPTAMLRRRRLQDAAQRIRAGESIARVAADLGYADQAHLSRDFRTMLDFTPSHWRAER